MNTEVRRLTLQERLELVELIQQSIGNTPDDMPLSDAQLQEVRRRVDAYRFSPRRSESGTAAGV